MNVLWVIKPLFLSDFEFTISSVFSSVNLLTIYIRLCCDLASLLMAGEQSRGEI